LFILAFELNSVTCFIYKRKSYLLDVEADGFLLKNIIKRNALGSQTKCYKHLNKTNSID